MKTLTVIFALAVTVAGTAAVSGHDTTGESVNAPAPSCAPPPAPLVPTDVIHNGYRNGKKHGFWIERPLPGRDVVTELNYVDGKKHGLAVTRYYDGGPVMGETNYVDGKKHGLAVSRAPNGEVHESNYVDGKAHGPWVTRYPNGEVYELNYVDGVRQEPEVWRYPDGRVKHVTWRKEVVNGMELMLPYEEWVQ